MTRDLKRGPQVFVEGTVVRREEADGTRIYRSWNRYKPVAPEARKIGVNKPDDPRALCFNGRWFLPLDLLDDEVRVMPETIPDELAYEHMERRAACRCVVCQRPAAERWRRQWRRDRGLRA